MKLERPTETDDTYYLHFTDKVFVHAINDWAQLRGGFNWYTFHFVHIYLENDKMTGGLEFEFAILGLGFRLRWNHSFEESEAGQRLKEYEQNDHAK